MAKPNVLLDPKPRWMAWVFTSEDYERLNGLVNIITYCHKT